MHAAKSLTRAYYYFLYKHHILLYTERICPSFMFIFFPQHEGVSYTEIFELFKNDSYNITVDGGIPRKKGQYTASCA